MSSGKNLLRSIKINHSKLDTFKLGLVWSEIILQSAQKLRPLI